LLNRGFTAYHIVDWRRQWNRFQDTRLPVTTDTNVLLYYPQARLSRTATDDRAQTQQVENTVGVLGRTEAVEYRLYARQRNLSLLNRNLLGDPGITQDVAGREFTGLDQIFLGGTAAFRYKIFAIETAGELKLADEYWLRGAAKLGPLTGELLSTSYSPTLTQQEFDGNHYRWNNIGSDKDFRNTKVNQLTVRADQTLGRHRVEASTALINITDLVYYDEVGVPTQFGSDRRLLTASLRHRFNVGNFFLDNQAHATSGGDDEAVRIPALLTNSKVYYQGYLFKQALFGQVGAEVYYQSTWRPYDYSVSTQQFYAQNTFKAANFAVADVFVSGDIRTVAVFLKVAYVNQGIGRNGYFTTPYYTGLPRRFQLGIRWQFFD
ncbi:MAG TPA: putative porin, partial [Hymenobacter sp.]|nr:putative porin [Hymenobacter sp.]